MEEMVGKGLTKSIGVSNFNRAQLQRLLQSSTIKPANLQIECHIYLQQNELVNFCKDNNVLVTAYAPLGSKGIEALNRTAGIEYGRVEIFCSLYNSLLKKNYRFLVVKFRI